MDSSECAFAASSIRFAGRAICWRFSRLEKWSFHRRSFWCRSDTMVPSGSETGLLILGPALRRRRRFEKASFIRPVVRCASSSVAKSSAHFCLFWRMFARVSFVNRFNSLVRPSSLAERFYSIRSKLLCEIQGFLEGLAIPGLEAAIMLKFSLSCTLVSDRHLPI